MKVIQLAAQQQASVKALQDQFKNAQAVHVASHKALLAHLQSISGGQAERGKRTKLAVPDDGQNIVVM